MNTCIVSIRIHPLGQSLFIICLYSIYVSHEPSDYFDCAYCFSVGVVVFEQLCIMGDCCDCVSGSFV